MGARTSNRKREDEFLSFNRAIPSQNSSDFHVSKRLRFSPMHQSPERPVVSSNSSVARLSRYPAVTPRLGREVHAPCRIVNYGVSTGLNRKKSELRTGGILKKLEVFDEMGNILSHNYNKAKESAMRTFRYFRKEKGNEVIEVDSDNEKAGVSEDSSIEEVEAVTNVEVLDLDNSNEVMERGVQQQHLPSSSSQVSGYLANGNLRMDNAEKMLDSLSLNQEVVELNNVSAYKKLLEAAERRSSKLKNLNFQIELKEKQRSFLQTLQPAKKPVEAVPQEPFVLLSKEEKAEVERAFNTNRRKVLVTHDNSNIEITGELLLCLRPGAWLNDEVINVYLELLKEREKREPQKFLKCHFFNTFFYKKIISGKGGYDYKSVRRWTSQRKLGYGLIECDKIFVPIHKEIHWCLAVINMKDEKLQYLDSLGGKDTQVLRVLARYFVDEVKDKSGRDIDLSSWTQEFVEDLPEQKNGFDCGMFMIKYADFYSRGLGLCFSQEHMPYFRQRTAKEILRLRAD